ncbi:hypothetical protein GCWU000324_02779 [Kingella oralis ATCC 51147]|uniref:Uncharacterized protein n=1 Tax=Kingella oralis ATCC 51147 TaxID=629741 RepID=C4GM47_9NEIS|nr:hypothetical protein GCWU000324_02779 [Kingella oralis ATCC 51147]
MLLFTKFYPLLFTPYPCFQAAFSKAINTIQHFEIILFLNLSTNR